MERGNKERILEIIKAIENKNIEMDEYISNLSILSRNDMLKKITQDIINNNSILQEIIGRSTKVVSSEVIGKNSSEEIIENYINKIQEDSHKKIIILRDFLDLFQERISETDKEVILKSLKDIKNEEKLREEMQSLANIFKLDL
ncbi:MAG: hypothetical protein ACFFDH_07625 [Promethearchaeota archaeon]